MRSNPICWFEIHVADMNRARAFYEGVFELKLERLDTPGMEYWAFPNDCDRIGAGGALIRMEGVAPGGNSTLVYFACQDCAVEEAHVPGYGGQIEKTKTSIGPYGFISLVRDTEGNLIGLHSIE